jgi:hypothetical protein
MRDLRGKERYTSKEMYKIEGTEVLPAELDPKSQCFSSRG